MGAGIWSVNRHKFQDHDFAPSTILQSDAAEGTESPTVILPTPVDCMVTSFPDQQQNRVPLPSTSYVRDTKVSPILTKHSVRTITFPS